MDYKNIRAGMRENAFPRFIFVSALWVLMLLPTFGRTQAALLVLIFGDRIATEKFHTSIDAGLNIASMSGDAGSKAKAGLYFGLGTFLKLNEKWAFVPELKPLSQRNVAKVSPLVVYNEIHDPTYSFKLNYIDIPMPVQYRIKPNLFVSAGPQISFRTSGVQLTTGSINGTDREIEITEKVAESFRAAYFSFPVEVGFSLPDVIPGQGIDVKLRYCPGISNFMTADGHASRMSLFQFFASFPFIKKASPAP
jgi:hypothetical protein